MRRRKFWRVLAGTGCGLVLARAEWALAEEAGPLRVVFYTDVHSMPGLTGEKLFYRTAESIANERAEVIIAGGDVIHRGHLSRIEDCKPRFALYRKFLEKLPPGVCHVVGNHDLAGARPEDGSEPASDPWKAWREELGVGQPCRTFEAGGIRFFLLDTLALDLKAPVVYRGEAGEERLDWLRRQVANTPPEQPLILCTHIPLVSDFLKARHPTPPPNSLQTVDSSAILKIFEGRRLIAVLQGHLHFREEMRVGEIPVITAGAVSGAWWKGSNEDTPPGYARLDIRDGRMTWEYLAMA